MNDLPRGLSSYAEQLEQLEGQSRRAQTVRIPPPPFDEILDEAARAVTDWNRPCQAAFEVLAYRFPNELAKLIHSNRLEPADLTFAAEALGRSNVGWLIRPALKPLLQHSSAVVREGAIYGLQKHIDPDIRAALVAIAKSDSSHAVRTAADDAISDQ